MNVSLTSKLETFVTGKVQSGRYTSASEVIREALRLLEEQERLRAAPLADFQAELDRRIAALDRGERVDPAVVRSQLRARSAARRTARR